MNFSSEIEKIPLVKIVSETAKESGKKVFLVGGVVRDLLLKRDRSDLDFLVIGNSLEFAEIVATKLGLSKVTKYRNFGTAHFNFENYSVEFVGARRESYKRDSRKPIIEDGTFEDDIKRRDFTINAMAISLNRNDFGELIDLFNGYDDLEKKLIRTPLDPFQTFDDDPLRIMRAFRFASQLNFNVDEAILSAAREMKERLQIVSQERITDEFLKILASPKPSIGLNLMFETEVLKIVFPEIHNLSGVEQRNDYHHKDVFIHTLMVVDNISKVTDNIWLRFAALVHDIAKPHTKKFIESIGWTFHGHEEIGARMMKNIFHRMKLPLTKLEYVEKLVRLHLRPIALAKEEVTDSAIRRLIVQAGDDLLDLITLCRADITSKNPQKVEKYLSNYDAVMQKVLDVQEKDKLRAFQSPVRGDEIMRICNLSPSRKVGEIKKAIEEAILDGVIENSYEAALDYLYKIKDKFLNEKNT